MPQSYLPVELICQTVQDCGQLAQKLAAQGFEIYQKAPGDFVTDVDRALDQHLTQVFSTQFPQDGLITEENVASIAAFQAGFDRLWCIDPLDGTQDFMNGDPDYAVMVGLLEDQHPIAGWIYAPEHDLMYYGGSQLGLWQMQAGIPHPLTPQHPSLEKSSTIVIGMKDRDRYGNAIAAQLPDCQFWCRPGSFGLKVMEVLLGQAGLYVYFNQRVKVWDTVAPLALAARAGLVCCDLMGKPIAYTVESLDLQTLTHRQPIILGWPTQVERYLSVIARAVLGAG
ncbi:MAG: inositol monophosphatase family protein [Synechococcales bacterium]|nr:inositol monophosphatase family protein [Synechococcales bacterium]